MTDDEAAINVMNLINAIGDVKYTMGSKSLIDDANGAYAILENDQKLLVANYDKLVQANTDYDKVDEAVGKINAIGDLEYTPDKKALIDDARETYDALSPYQKSIFPEDVLKKLIDDEKAYDSMDKIRAIGKIENTAACKEKIEKARETYNALKEDQKNLVIPSFVKELEDAEAVFHAIEKVNAIGDLEYTPDKKALIDDARETYDALSPYQKSIFPEDVLKKLIDDEKAYDSMDKIRAIGKIENTAACKEKIEKARETYNALKEDQKSLVIPLFVKELEGAEAAFNSMEIVNVIGKVQYNDDSKALIDNARKAYDALTADQKALVPESVIHTLETAETTYETKDKNAKILSTVLNIVLVVILAAGIAVLILLLRERKNDKKDGGTKLMGVSVLPVLLASNHYFDARFIILYVLAALAVAVWVADLVLFLKKRKDNQKDDA